MAIGEWISKSASEWIGGIKSFLHFPYGPKTRPTEDYQLTNKHWTVESDSCDKLVVSVSAPISISANMSPRDGDIWIDMNRQVPVTTFVDKHVVGIMIQNPFIDRLHTALCNAVSGSIDVLFPDAESFPYEIRSVVKIDGSANPVYITPTSCSINNTATAVISTQWGAYSVISDGQNWYTFNRDST